MLFCVVEPFQRVKFSPWYNFFHNWNNFDSEMRWCLGLSQSNQVCANIQEITSVVVILVVVTVVSSKHFPDSSILLFFSSGTFSLMLSH